MTRMGAGVLLVRVRAAVTVGTVVERTDTVTVSASFQPASAGIDTLSPTGNSWQVLIVTVDVSGVVKVASMAAVGQRLPDRITS